MRFICQACRRQYREKHPRCECGVWEQIIQEGREEDAGPTSLADIEADERPRMSLGIGPLDDFYDGGLVHGTTNLMYGGPGWGKSTLLLQVAKACQRTVLYGTSEETENEVALRAKRLGFGLHDKERILIQHSTAISEVLDEDTEAELLIIDSAHGFTSMAASGQPGDVHQVKAVTGEVVRFGQLTGIPILLVGQVNKKNGFAGAMATSHGVSSESRLRMVRGVRTMVLKKNRHGPTPRKLTVKMGTRGMEFGRPEED